MKNLLKNKFVKLFLRDAAEAAVVVEPLAIIALREGLTQKALVGVASAFLVAFVAAARRQLFPQEPQAPTGA